MSTGPPSEPPREPEEEVEDQAASASASDAASGSLEPPPPEATSGAGEPTDTAPAVEEPSQAPAEEEPTPPQEAPAPPEEAPVAAEAAAEPPVEGQQPQAPAAAEELPETPRRRPEIPGADLIPDIMPPEQEEFLDAEARAAAEAEAEARALREREEDEELQAEPIADAAIDLAAGARYSATGKRKSAVARVILKPGSGAYAINGKQLPDYFPRETLQRLIRQPLETVGYDSRMDVVARMHGGGSSAQAGALRHGISRALIEADPHLRGELKRRGFLTRDPRVKERKKAGLKKARKRPQFSKR